MSKPSGRRHQYMNTSKLRVCVCVAQLTLASVELYVGSACVCACVCVLLLRPSRGSVRKIEINKLQLYIYKYVIRPVHTLLLEHRGKFIV